MLKSCCVYAGWADPGCQTPSQNSTLKFCAHICNRKYYGIIFPTEESITEPAVRYILQCTDCCCLPHLLQVCTASKVLLREVADEGLPF